MRFLVIGGMNLDVLGMSCGAFCLRDSNIGHVTLRPGGVGRNIASELCTLGGKVSLLTALGQGIGAELLKTACARDGIDLTHSVLSCKSACTYLCIHDSQGDMIAAVNDMDAMTDLTPDKIDINTVNSFDLCVLDANLPEDTLLHIARNATVPLFLDPVSCAKVPRVKRVLPHLTGIKPNRMEAEALTGKQDMNDAANELLQMGVKRVFISLGGEGSLYADQHTMGILPAIPLPRVPLTGAGDAMCAGLAMALAMGKSTEDCALSGRQAAYDKLTSHE